MWLLFVTIGVGIGVGVGVGVGIVVKHIQFITQFQVRF